MAAEADGIATGEKERTGTVECMARGISKKATHQAFRDCESVYWLCAMALISKRTVSDLKVFVEDVTNISQSTLRVIYIAKVIFIQTLDYCTRLEGQDRENYIMEQKTRPIASNIVQI